MKLTIKELNILEDLVTSELQALDTQKGAEAEIDRLEALQAKIIQLGNEGEL